MKKLLPILLFSGICASAFPVSACYHVHHIHENDGWGSFAVGSLLGAGVTLAATAASSNADHHPSRSALIIDLEDQNDQLKERCAALRAEIRDLEQQIKDLEAENDALRHKIKKMERSGSKLMIQVDTD